MYHAEQQEHWISSVELSTDAAEKWRKHHTLLWSGLTWSTVLLFGRPTLRRTDISLKEYRNEQLTGSAPSGIQQRSRGVIPMRMNLNSTGYQSPNDTKLYPCVKHTDCELPGLHQLYKLYFTLYLTGPNRPSRHCMLRCVQSRINAFRHSFFTRLPFIWNKLPEKVTSATSYPSFNRTHHLNITWTFYFNSYIATLFSVCFFVMFFVTLRGVVFV